MTRSSWGRGSRSSSRSRRPRSPRTARGDWRVQAAFRGHASDPISFWHVPIVRALRRELLQEHLGREIGHLDDGAAFRLYREIARSNAAGEPLEGLAFAPATYAS